MLTITVQNDGSVLVLDGDKPIGRIKTLILAGNHNIAVVPAIVTKEQVGEASLPAYAEANKAIITTTNALRLHGFEILRSEEDWMVR